MSINLYFTPCESEINDRLYNLSSVASELLKDLEHGSPAFYKARLIAQEIDSMMDRLQIPD